MTSYLSEDEAENPQNGDAHLAQIPDFELEYLENHLAYLNSVMARFLAFFTFFRLSVTFFRTEVPLSIFDDSISLWKLKRNIIVIFFNLTCSQVPKIG